MSNEPLLVKSERSKVAPAIPWLGTSMVPSLVRLEVAVSVVQSLGSSVPEFVNAPETEMAGHEDPPFPITTV